MADVINMQENVKETPKFDPKKKDAKNMPFASCYIEVDSKEQISESGFNEFPYVVPR